MKKFLVILLLVLSCLFLSTTAQAASRIYACTSFIGGGAGALDKLADANLADSDGAIVFIISGAVTEVWYYVFDNDSAVAESSPRVIQPDDAGGNGRWILTSTYRQPQVWDDPGDTATLTIEQVHGGIVTNDGAGAGRTYNLPPAQVGMVVTVYLEEAQDVDIDCDGADQIFVLTDAAGNKISSDATQGSMIILKAHDATGWWPYGRVGAWADVN